jgi:hypothetical protein
MRLSEDDSVGMHSNDLRELKMSASTKRAFSPRRSDIRPVRTDQELKDAIQSVTSSNPQGVSANCHNPGVPRGASDDGF